MPVFLWWRLDFVIDWTWRKGNHGFLAALGRLRIHEKTLITTIKIEPGDRLLYGLLSSFFIESPCACLAPNVKSPFLLYSTFLAKMNIPSGISNSSVHHFLEKSDRPWTRCQKCRWHRERNFSPCRSTSLCKRMIAIWIKIDHGRERFTYVYKCRRQGNCAAGRRSAVRQ
jgi:hypothetical protein